MAWPSCFSFRLSHSLDIGSRSHKLEQNNEHVKSKQVMIMLSLKDQLPTFRENAYIEVSSKAGNASFSSPYRRPYEMCNNFAALEPLIKKTTFYVCISKHYSLKLHVHESLTKDQRSCETSCGSSRTVLQIFGYK